ncbi:MAG TPA: hypothetical protein EYH00_04170 [Archaeoglobus profundus]|nr:hypothetical protein [Archaeoglobus profundus]
MIMVVQHPSIIQIRGKIERKKEDILKVIRNVCRDIEIEIEEVKDGVDIYIPDVNVARIVVSRMKKLFRGKVKMNMSTKYAGMRKGKIRIVFVYSLRFI